MPWRRRRECLMSKTGGRQVRTSQRIHHQLHSQLPLISLTLTPAGQPRPHPARGSHHLRDDKHPLPNRSLARAQNPSDRRRARRIEATDGKLDRGGRWRALRKRRPGESWQWRSSRRSRRRTGAARSLASCRPSSSSAPLRRAPLTPRSRAPATPRVSSLTSPAA